MLDNLMGILLSIKITDVIDIVIVAYLLYKLLGFIKETRAQQLFRGVLLIIGFFLISEIFNLSLLNWLFTRLITVGLIAVVILFQPELRRMLDRLGSVKLRNLFGITKPVQELDAVIDQTVRACEVMSRERVGALIVFAREARLEEHMRTGTVIDAQVSEQLIRNIFFPLASLHDGAMIVRDGRVAAAGCVLPLSESNRLSADLGTRHRAGVGMSENSDAVVVIVSEETGTISVAVGGVLKRHLAPRTLEKLLHNELCPTEDAQEVEKIGKKLKNKLTRKETDTYEK